MKLSAGNYASRSDGAVYVSIGASRIYFHIGEPVAVVSDKTFYFADGAFGGIFYRRIREITLNQRMEHKKVSVEDLNNLILRIITDECAAEMATRFTGEP